ncbi:GH92 family glycosyl hydrolase [Paenibacillus antri]|nr:GH92 family glycosyl hydrolase [Paenibacillus antri]
MTKTRRLAYVNPLQGTASTFSYSNGNTLPIVGRPFGMASWSPQTDEAGGGWFFHPSHRHLQGIRLTHQPSPWIGDYGHLVLLPQTGPLCLEPGKRASSFKPEAMTIRPDLFRAELLRYRTTLELTPTMRCAGLRLRFPPGEEARLLLSLIDGAARVDVDPSERRVTGFTRANRGGAPDSFAMYFVMEFDCELVAERSGTWNDGYATSPEPRMEGNGIGAFIGLVPGADGVANVRIGTSFVSGDQAAYNLRSEVGGKDFEALRSEAAAEWEDTLDRIDVEDDDENRKRTFYSCFYRLCLFPRTWHEIDPQGRTIHYSPYNGTVCEGPMYSDQGFWDVYRTAYPLFSLLFPTLLGDILQGWVSAYREGGWLPKWASPGERSVMPGTLADAVFADAAAKGIGGFDLATAYEGLVKHATEPSDQPGIGRKGLRDYLEYGYLPHDRYPKESVSSTLDYAYGDFCIAQVARRLGKAEEAQAFEERAGNYKHLFDPAVGFMRGRHADGSWLEPFDPFEWGGPYCEGGPWQCSWAVQHDVPGLAALMGGKERMLERLRELLMQPAYFKPGSYGFEIHEMSEMAASELGQLAISNQPSFHIPYLFAALGSPAETQRLVRKTLDVAFGPGTDGFPGDEDNGSTAAWFMLSAMGLYPLCPGVPEYTLGSPLFDKVTIRLEDGGELVVAAEGNAPDRPYVSRLLVNGREHRVSTVSHATLAAGAELRFAMTDRPVSATQQC